MNEHKPPAATTDAEAAHDGAAWNVIDDIGADFYKLSEKYHDLAYKLQKLTEEMQASIAETQQQIEALKERQDG